MKQTLAAIKASGKIETCKNDISALKEALSHVPLWRPGVSLIRQCDEIISIIDDLQKRMDRKLVVTLIGPSGSGKSTLLNALSGVDDLSLTGANRPTTTRVLAFCQKKEDAAQLVENIGAGNVEIASSPAAQPLENLILIDTPDTDSTRQDKHIPIIKKAVSLSDMLICVFDAENPKRKDHTDFMTPYVARFGGKSIVIAMNKCDRQSETELSQTIVPDFKDYISKAWNIKSPVVLCTSGKDNLKNPGWDPIARPRNDLDRFDTLKEMIFTTFNQSGFSVDTRLANVRQLRDFIAEQVKTDAAKGSAALESALKKIRAGETHALKTALSRMKNDEASGFLAVNVKLYQNLAQRWIGPVGWLIALWAKLYVFGTGVLSLLRFGNPIRQVFGAVSAIGKYGESKTDMDNLAKGKGVDPALTEYANAVMKDWPDIAEILVKTGFNASVRTIEDAMPDQGHMSGQMLSFWSRALENAVDEAGRKLSGLFLQLVFNLPVLAVLGYTGWLTGSNFFTGSILSSDFFLHAFWTIILVLFLSFFIFQGIVRLAAGREKLIESAFVQVKEQADQYRSLSKSPVAVQVKKVMDLAEIKQLEA